MSLIASCRRSRTLIPGAFAISTCRPDSHGRRPLTLYIQPRRTSVQDKLLQKDVNLTDAELDIIRRLQKGENPDENYDPYQPTVHFFTQDVEVMPISSRPAPKSRFVASKWEHKKVRRQYRFS